MNTYRQIKVQRFGYMPPEYAWLARQLKALCAHKAAARMIH